MRWYLNKTLNWYGISYCITIFYILWTCWCIIMKNIFKGKMILSSTVILLKSAEPWKSMPISLRTSFFCSLVICVKFCPLYKISPVLGLNKPTRHFIKTVFPLPLAPMIRLHWPGFIVQLTSSITVFPLKLFFRLFTSII